MKMELEKELITSNKLGKLFSYAELRGLSRCGSCLHVQVQLMQRHPCTSLALPNPRRVTRGRPPRHRRINPWPPCIRIRRQPLRHIWQSLRNCDLRVSWPFGLV